MTNIIPTTNAEGLSGLLSAVLAQNANIQSSDGTLHEKAHNLMAAALVIVALLGTQLRNSQGDWRMWTISSMLVLITSVATVMYMTRNQKYADAVVDLRQHPEYFAMDSEMLLAQLIEDATSANLNNEEVLAHKKTCYRWGVIAFMFGFFLGIVSLFVA